MKNGLKIFFFASAFALTACTVYDNYDIELMQDPAALLESSSSAEEDISSSSEESESKGQSSSSEEIENKEKSSSSEEIENKERSSSSEEFAPTSSSAWPCGDSSLVMKDGTEYKTVLINKTCWMAENMRNTTKNGKSVCYSDEDFPDENSNCETYGRLYNIIAAKAVCPSGWLLPDTTDFQALYVYLKSDADNAGFHLKADHGWEDGGLGENGDDMLGFTGLPGGSCSEDGNVIDCALQGNLGNWWSSTPKEYDTHYNMKLFAENGAFEARGDVSNDYFLSVRCIKK